MKSPLRFLPLLLMPAFAVAGFLLYRTLAKDSSQTSLTGIKLPPGFRIALYAGNCPGARSLAVSPAGTVFVGTIKEGAVYALTDRDRDGCADEKIVVASGLFAPNGVAFRGGSLYVAEVNRLLRYDDIEKNLHKPKPPVVLDGSFPSDTHHGWKFIAFGPDGRLYVPVGAPCNVCERSDPRYATIMRMQAAGGRPEVFAQGVRNTVGFDWHGKTGHQNYSVFAEGWLSPAGVSGRPVDVANMPDGALLVSDDLKGAIYRIS